jgi:hypothetical protein
MSRARTSEGIIPGRRGALRPLVSEPESDHSPGLHFVQPTDYTERSRFKILLPELQHRLCLALRKVQEVLPAVQVRQLRVRGTIEGSRWAPTLSA